MTPLRKKHFLIISILHSTTQVKYALHEYFKIKIIWALQIEKNNSLTLTKFYSVS